MLEIALLGVWLQQPPVAADDWRAAEGRHLRNVRQLTFDGDGPRGFLRAGEAYFSPDGKSIIFQAVRGTNPFYQIYTMALPDGEPRLVSTGRGRTTCAFFRPDGRKIIYTSSHLDPNVTATEDAERRRIADEEKLPPSKRRRRYEWVFDEHMDIFEADLDGSHLKRLTSAPGYDAEGSYSPDGKKIVFCSMRDGDPDIFVMDADGGNVTQVTNAPGYDGGPFFSPDGRKIAFRSDRKEKDLLQLYVVNADGTGERALTDNRGVNWCPYWSPDGSSLIYAFADYSDQKARPNFDLYSISSSGGTPHRVTFAPAADVLPVYSPDGKRLLWTSARRDGAKDSQLFTADLVSPEAVPPR